MKDLEKDEILKLLSIVESQEKAWEVGKLSLYTPHNGKYKDKNGKDLPGPPWDGQEAFHRSDATVRMAITGNRFGKGIFEEELVMTPEGYRKVKDVCKGDLLIGADGKPTKVIGVFPQGEQELYRFVFNDGSSVVCDKSHLWKCQTRYNRFFRVNHEAEYGKWKVLSTEEILKFGLEPKAVNRITIPMTKAIEFTQQDVPIDPYVLGVLLGDGSFRNGQITITNPEDEIINSIANYHEVKKRCSDESRCDYVVKGIRNSIKELGLLNLYSDEKFVPEIYLLNSVEVRLELLRGLMDTDGYAAVNTHEYSTTSERLKNDVKFLVETLGGSVTISKRKSFYKKDGIRKQVKDSYRVFIWMNDCPYRFSKKSNKWRKIFTERNRVLHKIEPVGTGRSICFKVDAADELFLTSNCIVTHNTTMSFIEAIWLCTGTHPYHQKWKVPIRGKVYAESYSMFMDTWAQKIEEWLPRSLLASKRPFIYSNQGQIMAINFANGSYIKVGTYDQQEKKSEGSNWHFVAFDEPPPRELYIANFRSIVDFGGKIWLTATPLSEAWMYDDLWIPGKSGKKDYIHCFDGCSESNQHTDRKILKLFYDEMTEDERKTRYYGEFKKLKGLVIDTYDSEFHDVDPFKLDADYVLYEGIDPHPGKPHAVLWKAVHQDGTRYVVKELKLDGGMYELAERIHEVREYFREQHCEVICSVADTSLNQKGADYRANLWVELKRYLAGFGETLMPELAAKRDWLHAGIAKVRDLYRPVLRDGEMKAQQYVFKDCTQYKYELMHYQWPKADDLSDEVKPVSKYNDLLDCCRYIESKAPKYHTPGSGIFRTNKNAYTRIGRERFL